METKAAKDSWNFRHAIYKSVCVCVCVCVYLSYIVVYNNVSNISLLIFLNFSLPNSEDTLLAHPDKIIGLMN